MGPRTSFQRLDDNTWGVRVDAFEHAHRFGGQEVSVTKRDGTSTRVTLGSVVTSWNGGRTSVYRIAKTSVRAAGDEPRRRESVAAGGVEVLAPSAPEHAGPIPPVNDDHPDNDTGDEREGNVYWGWEVEPI